MHNQVNNARSDESDSSCRLHVFLAVDNPLGLVLRRGPSAWVRLSLWHTDRDEFVHGQWFAGRVYERRSDISPDGSLFVYFARRSSNPSGQDTWLAISRPPWFTALCLWFVGGTYFTGGHFASERSVWLGGIDSEPDQGNLPEWLRRSTHPAVVDRSVNWTERTVYFNRLRRGGWRQSIPTSGIWQWERTDPTGRQTLVMTELSESSFEEFGGPHITHYSVRDESSGDEQDLGRLDWADWDHRGRLVYARDGRLCQWRASEKPHVIADLRAQEPDPQPSPPEARIWPNSPPDTQPS